MQGLDILVLEVLLSTLKRAVLEISLELKEVVELKGDFVSWRAEELGDQIFGLLEAQAAIERELGYDLMQVLEEG